MEFKVMSRNFVVAYIATEIFLNIPNPSSSLLMLFITHIIGKGLGINPHPSICPLQSSVDGRKSIPLKGS